MLPAVTRRARRTVTSHAGSDTAFEVAVGGHRTTVTQSDGFPVVPVPTDALPAKGERFDVTLTSGDGTAGKKGSGRAGTAPWSGPPRATHCHHNHHSHHAETGVMSMPPTTPRSDDV